MALMDRSVRDFDALRRAFRWNLPARFNIAEAVCDRHAAGPQRPALIYENARGDVSRHSFGELLESSARLANALEALGTGRGDRVAIILPQRLETGLAHIATWRLGAISVPLSILFGPDALEYRLRDSGARVVITDAAHRERVEDLRDSLPALEHVLDVDATGGDGSLWRALERGAAARPVAETVPDDPALLVYTSGTTGPPKGALVPHRALIGNLPGFELSQGFFPGESDVFWTPADWAWTGGLMDALLPTWYYGRPIVAFESTGRFDAERACAMMAKHDVTNAFIPPTALKMIRQVPDLAGRYRLRLRAVMSAGEAVGAELVEWGRAALGLTINEMWGQTECNYLVGNCSEIMPVRPGAMGKPYPGHDVNVIDEHGNPVADGEQGELAARSPDAVMFLGYWGRDDATREKFTGPWFRTGDVGVRDEDGYLWFVGRKDDVISSAGYRIGPGEIEDCLLKHPAVSQAAVVGVPDELRGEVIKAYIVLATGYQGTDALAEEIRRSVRDRLAAYEYPRQVEFIAELPMTTTGKVRRMELRERARVQGRS